MKYATIDIGGTFIKYALLDEQMNILERKQVLTMALGDVTAFYDYVCEEILCDGAEKIAICAPGIMDEQGIVITASSGHASIMYQSNVVKEITKRMNMPVTCINDAKAAGLCELIMGNCKGSKRSVCYIIGTGIGGCLLDEQSIVKGHNHICGEFSYMPVWGQDGRLEQLGNHASMASLVKAYQSLHPNQQIDGKKVCERYLLQEEDAVACVNHWLDAIIMQFISITVIYDPEVICVGGGISQADWFIHELQERYVHACKVFISDTLNYTTRITSCHFHNDANVIGAALYASQQ